MSRLFDTEMSRSRWTPPERLLFARASCLCFGIGLLLWSLAPLIVARLIRSESPQMNDLLFNGATLLLAGMFIGFYSLIREGPLWPVWSAFVLASIFLGAGLTISVINGFIASSSFVLFLSAMTTLATWMAIDAVQRERREIIAAVTRDPRTR